jgi:thymidine phosphorylase
MLISVEHALNIDSRGQMIASVLSKKVAAGATHVVLDLPVGPTAKIRTMHEANMLATSFALVGSAVGLHVESMITDGSQPVGRGIGPALEAIDVLEVLRQTETRPMDLEERSLSIAARFIGRSDAEQILKSGAANKKFEAICIAQGGFTEPRAAAFTCDVFAESQGRVQSIDNRKLARIAKLAGAPKTLGAGIEYFAPIGRDVDKHDTMFKIYAGSQGELEYATEYYRTAENLIVIS